MNIPQKTVLIVQPAKHQAQVWYSALGSQDLAVIVESANVDLMAMLTQMRTAKLNLPDLILLDLAVNGVSPYVFCRWCRDNYPELNIVLTNAGQKSISEPERDWAIYQGAKDLLPGFQKETLMTGVVEATNLVLQIMGLPPARQDKLIQTLFTMTSNSSKASSIQGGSDLNPPMPNVQSPNNQITGPAAAQNINPITGPKMPITEEIKTDNAPPKRRYRGSSY
ncbi:MAG: response regulator [Pseudanabaenaceae cyanobacterium]|jgi:CheY-like chemotaxis protein